jgi:TlyA family rRNA methyltransferase/putative hemolysin
LREILTVGWPIGGSMAVESWFFLTTGFLVWQFGTAALAAHQVAVSFSSISYMIVLALSHAATYRVAHAMGARTPLAARRAGAVAIIASVLFMSVVACGMWLFAKPIVGIYLDLDDPANFAVLPIAITLIGIAALFQIADGLQCAAAGALRGLKDTRATLIAALFGYWVAGIGSGLGLGFALGYGTGRVMARPCRWACGCGRRPHLAFSQEERRTRSRRCAMTAGERRRADQLLVDRGLAESRARAQALILAGVVFSGSTRIDKPGTSLLADAALEVRGKDHPWVSRGGVKLDHALNYFGIDPSGLICLDVGASTGGFTDVLLARGAAKVYAVDVGHGQLAWKLRQDARVVVLERTNARHLTRAEIPEPIELIVCDASFIGLETVITRHRLV